MNSGIPDRLQKLIHVRQQHLLRHGLKGLEKESLRLDPDGKIAHSPHPSQFGSALTHPWITTDYSEALPELITPPFAQSAETLAFLASLHTFAYRHLGEETLLATSMPIGIRDDESIPIARYGHSNIGYMKHVYRRGLAWRYGRMMQSIAGVHFNYSVNESLWPVLKDLEGSAASLQAFTADAYFGLIRNIHRYGWLLIYLFGNSPAICRSFFAGRESLAARFPELDTDTLFRPHATSLRMSDIGYRNDNQTSLDISFNHIDDYVGGLEAAINQPCPAYERIGIKVDGEYRQINANILQIENEYYSTVRPKQVARSGEKPTLALRKRGVRYIELRSLDLDCFEPAGISLETLNFLETFMVFCLMEDSPPLTPDELKEAGQNGLSTACCARTPGFSLFRSSREIAIADWAGELLHRMETIADVLDDGQDGRPYRQSLEQQRPAIADPGATRSARVLREMQQSSCSFAEFALELTRRHADHWRIATLPQDQYERFEKDAEVSWQEQRQIEAADTITFDQFLSNYLKQR